GLPFFAVPASADLARRPTVAIQPAVHAPDLARQLVFRCRPGPSILRTESSLGGRCQEFLARKDDTLNIAALGIRFLVRPLSAVLADRQQASLAARDEDAIAECDAVEAGLLVELPGHLRDGDRPALRFEDHDRPEVAGGDDDAIALRRRANPVRFA